MLAKIIDVFPHPSKLAGLPYMEQTGTAVETRSILALMSLLGDRYGETDSERSWPWLNQFTEFARTRDENLKDFRARFLRTTTRLGTCE